MKEQLRKYAKLLARRGLNVQAGQEVWISAELDQPEFVTAVAEECYLAGAKKVVIDWTHQPASRLFATYCSLETMSSVADWEKEKYEYQATVLPCTLRLVSSDPDGMRGIDGKKLTQASIATYPIVKPYLDRIENRRQWCIAGVPGAAWAKKIFPDRSEAEAIDALWDAILKTARADGEDPIAAWDEHIRALEARCRYLNELHLKALEYDSENGTHLRVGLLSEGMFCGGGETSLRDIFFLPNIPTEEIFTSPKAGDAEGVVYSTKPLSYRGELIENFRIRFEDGCAVEAHAERGEELLRQMLAMDEGARRLGECALIPFDSPINNTGILFYNTLFDENASCHLALGRAYKDCVRNFGAYTSEELRKMGVNESMIHVDFMIGARDLRVVGVRENGERTVLLEHGNWAF